jgi:hypothetical protein
MLLKLTASIPFLENFSLKNWWQDSGGISVFYNLFFTDILFIVDTNIVWPSADVGFLGDRGGKEGNYMY